METRSDKDVLKYIRRSLAGDGKAFEWILEKYKKRLYFSIFQIVMNHDDADDILQETFIKTYTRLESYDESYPFYPWLYRIAVNTALNHQKKKARGRALSLDDMNGKSHNQELSEAPAQFFESEGNELIARVKEALKKLPTEQRAVFLLRVREELSYQEISDTLNISIGTVMSRLSRAREKLRAHLQPYLHTSKVEV